MKCQACHLQMETVERDLYQYIESGLDNLYLKGIDIYRCPECNEEVPVIHKAKELHRIIAWAILCRTEPLDGPEIRFLRKQMGYKSKDFAELVGVSPQAVSAWEKKGASHSAPHDRLIRTVCLLRLCEIDSKFSRIVNDRMQEYLDLLTHIEEERREERSAVQLTKETEMLGFPYRYSFVPIPNVA